MRMAFVGRHERMSAQRAYELGMISQIVDPPERLREEAQALAEKIARNSPAAMAGDEAGAVGRARAGPDRRLPRRRRRAGLDVGPPRPGGGPAGVRREARAPLAEPHRALTFAGRFPDQSGLTYTYGRGRSRTRTARRVSGSSPASRSSARSSSRWSSAAAPIIGFAVLFLVFVPLEKLFALRPQKVFRRSYLTDLTHFVVNNLFVTVGAIVLVVVAALPSVWLRAIDSSRCSPPRPAIPLAVAARVRRQLLGPPPHAHGAVPLALPLRAPQHRAHGLARRRPACTRSTPPSPRRSRSCRCSCSATTAASSPAPRCSSRCSRSSSTPTCGSASPGCAGS